MRRILVIDDESNIRSIIYKLLDGLGYEVKVAEDGEKGIKLFDEIKDFDLVITDIRMPNMDGIEVAAYIRKSDKTGTPLVAMTGFPEEIQMEMFDGLLIKPFSLRALIDMVESFVKPEFDLTTESNDQKPLGLQPM